MSDQHDAKAMSRAQFGANSARYATSEVHAQGASLTRLVQLVAPEPDWYALDVATAAGHTAFAFAPHVASVVASDLTPEMVRLAERRAAELGHENVIVERADAEALPFGDATFDLVTCRIAPHHFPDPGQFVAEVARVLRPGGAFGFVDNVVPDDDPDGEIARVYNDWERDRDPSHVRALSLATWVDTIGRAGFTIRHAELLTKRMSFADWVDNMNVPAEDRPDLLERLFDPGSALTRFLQPRGASADDASFALSEGLIVAVRNQSAMSSG